LHYSTVYRYYLKGEDLHEFTFKDLYGI